jgi:hypothetical protein
MAAGVDFSQIARIYPKATMQTKSLTRVGKTTIAASVLLLLLAMMLPVCHMHPLLDKSAPDHCTICVTLHAAPPLGVHLPAVVRLYQTGQVLITDYEVESSIGPRFAASRAPPLPAC